MRSAGRQLAASPVLIGAVTVLVAIVAVFISYNANQGLPFVPDLQAQRRDPQRRQARARQRGAGGRLPGRRRRRTSQRCAAQVDGQERSVALLELKLDKDIEPLSVDTTRRRAAALGARPQVRGAAAGPLRAHASRTGPRCRCATPSPPAPELEDVLSTFGPRTRAGRPEGAARASATRFAGRGADDQRDDPPSCGRSWST